MTDATREPLMTRLRSVTTGWPDDLLSSDRPAFLARKWPDGRVSWYSVAHTARQARELREHMLAFVGPSYSDFYGQPAEWDAADPVEAELAAFPNGFRLTIHPADAVAVLQLMTRVRQLLKDRPRRGPTDPPPLARMVRDFELLVRANDWPAASVQLERLRARGQLTASQLTGLHLQSLAGQERWAALLAVPALPELMAQRLPSAVSEGIAAAVFHEHLARFTSEDEAVSHYREHVAPAFGNLFRQRFAWRHPDAVAAGRIAEMAARRAVPEPPAADPYSAAVEAHRANDTEAAFRLLIAGPFTPESVRLLVEVAIDLGTLGAARASAAAVRACDAAVREKAFARRALRSLWDELQDISGAEEETAIPLTDWFGWLTRAAAGSWPQAVEVAKHGAKEWPRPDPVVFTTAFATSATKGFRAIRDALVPFLDAMLPEGKVDPALGSVYRQLLERLVLDDELTPNTAEAIHELASAVLQSNPVHTPERNDYAEVIECLATAWDRLKRPNLLDWGAGLLDLVAEHAVQRHAVVSKLVQDVTGEFARVPRLVTPGQRALLRTVCAELELPGAADALAVPKPAGDAAAPDEEAALRKKLGKRSVVLLTLGDRVAAMFRDLMRQRYPDARVEVAQERAGTKRLRDLAANADVFIVNTFDAKHAATGFVPQHRSPDATLYPKGKNAARQLDALDEWLRSVP